MISLYLNGAFQAVNIKDAQKLQKYTKNDLITRDQMANLGCLLVCTFDNFLESSLVAAHTVNNLNLGNEQSFESD